MRGCMSIGGIVGDCIATSFHVCGLSCSGAGGRQNTEGDPDTSCLAGANKGNGVILLVGVDAVVRPTAGIDVKTLEDAGKKLRQSP